MKRMMLMLFLSNVALAQNALPNPEETNTRLAPSDDTVRGEYQYQKNFKSESEKNAFLKGELEAARKRLESQANEASDQFLKIQAAPTTAKGTRSAPPRIVSVRPDRSVGSLGNSAIVQTFLVTDTMIQKTVLPLGSYVRAKVLSGVEANTQDAFPMLIQADYAFVGPNKTKIDLSHCFFIAKAKANLSAERVMGETTEMSCVAESGEHIRRAAKGFIAGEDSTFGMTGQLMSKQGQVLLAAVLANLAKGAGEAVGAAQTTSQIVATASGTDKVTNITGSKAAFVAGKSVADASSIIATWYLDYAKQLVPSIAVGSGRNVWLIMLDSVEVPEISQNNSDAE